MNKRPIPDQYYMNIAKVVASRSTCLRRQIGCVIVNNDKIVSTGYNGAVRGAKHCLEAGCVRDKLGIESGTKIESCQAVHAEQNALIQSGKHSEGATLFVTTIPCITCAKMIINAGIKRAVIPMDDDYPDKKGVELLKELKIIITFMR